MFSPYYAWRLRQGAADPANHCAVNVALYGRSQNRWAMTERGRDSLARDRNSLSIGRSSFVWDGTCLTMEIDERTAPWPSRIRGTIRVQPAAVSTRTFILDGAGRHRWRPFAPCATITVALDQPSLRWSGTAYIDTNTGDEPLGRAFRRWDWSRAMTPSGTTILYDVTRRDGSTQLLAIGADRHGRVDDRPPLPKAALPRTMWRLDRVTRADAGYRPAVLKTLEDAPFYARSVLSSQLHGLPVTAIHESLSLDRFAAPIVQAMLPFRMPRALR